jgi:hypothetical protein
MIKRESTMADENFGDNLLRMVAAELHFSNCVAAAREMFGKSYFALGGAEKIAIDQAVFGHFAGNYQAITPDALVAQKAPQPVGFQAPAKGQL